MSFFKYLQFDSQGLFYMKCTKVGADKWLNAGVACKTPAGNRVEVNKEFIKDGHVHRFDSFQCYIGGKTFVSFGSSLFICF